MHCLMATACLFYMGLPARACLRETRLTPHACMPSAFGMQGSPLTMRMMMTTGGCRLFRVIMLLLLPPWAGARARMAACPIFFIVGALEASDTPVSTL